MRRSALTQNLSDEQKSLALVLLATMCMSSKISATIINHSPILAAPGKDLAADSAGNLAKS